MQRKIIKTADGSTTIYLEDWDEHYHSRHGAIQEAFHVFIRMGLEPAIEKFNGNMRIMEIGFGTGLNAYITLLEALMLGLKISYTGVEAYPVEAEEWTKLNYGEELQVAPEFAGLFEKLHLTPWETPEELAPEFSLLKRKQFFQDIDEKATTDLIYFDAFGARVQPELWEQNIFQRMYDALVPGGILVTYAAKGSVRRAMKAVGFNVEKLPGPPGKREMMRAVKPAE
ncbi:SAM-dependent methyltransferase [Robertkochia marina]|uniref:SAM-dependent methyltransferase n=1 Tax=Robertkochia marina TaxID=1227945 RepID=A0A4S3M1M7_9FLAO|nr:tRNA (5-methylaminomethyl-2-thiouridine)(34)-methyltransferase MnmD [Robertkochia marina]THD67355.1 SAM-dependent methyltransferase [Robertkochia marina]TRZ43011.1 SAM-dependent methyltransferase [Robertkochia marina]